MRHTKQALQAFGLLAALVLVPLASDAFELRFQTDANEDMADVIRGSSLLASAQQNDVKNTQDILATARAEYRQILATLYKQGYYSGTISIQVDGEEAATLPPFFTPKAISEIIIKVQTGRPFKFGKIAIGPLAEATKLPDSFSRGGLARSTLIAEAVDSSISGWRDAGHAKATTASQSVIADHRRNRLDASIALDPGPLVYFGSLNIQGAKNVKERRIRQIAGLRKGAVFSPEALDRVADRLRATGTFRSVALSEGEVVAPDGTMDITARLVTEKPRRFGFGAEVSSLEGAAVSAYWMHRNIFGGAERLRFDGSIGGLGSTTSGIDYSIAARFSRPGTTAPANTLNIDAELAQLDEPEFQS
ncbi:MAG: POTRA domain-containing protein, partial [Paracoccaceae bacterium]